MSILNALSAGIKIIPISQNRNDYYNGRRLSEENLTTIFKQLSNNNHPSFIIDAVTDEDEITKIQFILGGYYIELTDTSLLNQHDNLYVGIKITTDDNTKFTYLHIYDDNNSLYGDGITFSDEDLSSNNYTYTLPLIINNEIPIASRFRFNSNEIENINGGIV